MTKSSATASLAWSVERVGWRRLGHMALPNGAGCWRITHAQCPTPYRIDERTIRVYFGTRDADNRTRPTFVDLDADQPTKIVRVAEHPVLDLGPLGAFDDCGVMPSCIVANGNRLLLYYGGWNKDGTVPYRIGIGIAESRDGGETFQRLFEGPILDRSRFDPYFCSTPCVVRHGQSWRMWYLSGTKWRIIDGRTEPQYEIRSATSDDGIDWQPDLVAAIPHGVNEAIARPWLLHEGFGWRMWFCTRELEAYRTDPHRGYRIASAVSHDGTSWRREAKIDLDSQPGDWDADMACYPAIVDAAGRRLLFYNGNDFGRFGFGVAELEGSGR